ncbi:MAG: DUF6065 family protein [Pyrinomonadaceae bacterium]
MLEVQIFPLVSKLALPVAATAATRSNVPPGYGVQEHCLPFTAATALGFLIRSPISFGICAQEDVPRDGHAFRSPLARPLQPGVAQDDSVFYVKDDANCGFAKNAFTLDVLDDRKNGWSAPRQPGISFFDREDQQDLFKLHLPYIWRTPVEVDALFLPVINRSSRGLNMLSGLVETDWYASQVNLVFGKSHAGYPVHVSTGDFVAQIIFVPRSHRRPSLRVLAPHARTARDMRAELAEWYRQHGADRSAYKRLARSQHGRIKELHSGTSS